MKEDQSGWFKSSYSGQNGDCVEARHRVGSLDVRDSKDFGGPAISVAAPHWAAFTSAVREGAFDIR